MKTKQLAIQNAVGSKPSAVFHPNTDDLKQITEYRLLNTDYRIQIAEHRLPNTDY